MPKNATTRVVTRNVVRNKGDERTVTEEKRKETTAAAGRPRTVAVSRRHPKMRMQPGYPYMIYSDPSIPSKREPIRDTRRVTTVW
ncbi:MAG: hypothetical protein IAF94_09695 [Pirellulaceae bacterium]|nr:hypothetical protein [Pirellulaceae bacterium]